MKIKTAFLGACGKMGRSMIEGVLKENDIDVVGAVDILGGEEIIPGSGIISETCAEQMIRNTNPDIVVDFTTPSAVKNNIMLCLSLGKSVLVGTTGLSAEDLEEIDASAKKSGTVVFVVPNFALGAVLMMNFAAKAGKYFSDVEVIELHHNQKKDAPSGTAVKTMEMIAANREPHVQGQVGEVEKISGSRGGDFEGMRVHSVRLPGYVAHQEVIFGGTGQVLTIRHDSMNRESFVPGLLLALRNMGTMEPGLVYGLEKVMDL